MRQRRPLGFTLVEVLVALGIVAIALGAGLQATAALTRNAQRQTDVLLGQMCAENELVKIRLTKQMPGVGDTQVDCEQAGHRYRVQLAVRPTPNTNFRRVDARVLDGETPILNLSTVVGRF
jgi:general secretion pathway protein I